MLACNALIGLDPFEKVACTKNCEAADGGFDARPMEDAKDQRDASDGDIPIEFADAAESGTPIPIPEGASPTSWARQKMPNPEGGVNPYSYTSNSDTSVTDKVTGFVWQDSTKTVVPGEDAFAKARLACATLGDGGTVWRLPTRIELVTLIDLSRADGGAFHPVFKGILDDHWYWTSSVVRPPTLPYHFWAVNFGSGEVSPDAPGAKWGVICVKGAP